MQSQIPGLGLLALLDGLLVRRAWILFHGAVRDELSRFGALVDCPCHVLSPPFCCFVLGNVPFSISYPNGWYILSNEPRGAGQRT